MMPADLPRRLPARIEIRVRDALADLVSILVVHRYDDGTTYAAGLLSMPLADYRGVWLPMFRLGAGLRSGVFFLDDDTTPRGIPHDGNDDAVGARGALAVRERWRI